MKSFAITANAALVAVAASLISVAASAANAPDLVSNAQHYQEKNPSAATGRSGSASLEVRALVGKDDVTTIDITTGTLDSADVAPGNIDKVQLKAINEDGEVRWTHNDAKLSLGGTLQYTVDDLHAGNSVQVQAKVTGIDGKRADIVTVTGGVKRRPDLAVQQLDAPEMALVDTLVNISATVSELNGDVGATGDCVLMVDGIEVDRAEGIYVDSGSTVSCAFTYELDTIGNHALEVHVGDVIPGDWDMANNSATGSIEIIHAQIPFTWSASARRNLYTYHRVTDYSYLYNGSYIYRSVSHEQKDHVEATQEIRLYGYASARVKFPLAHANVKFFADDEEVSSIELENMQPTSKWGNDSYGSDYFSYFDPVTYTYLYISGYTSLYGYKLTTASARKYAGAVTYFSQKYFYRWYDYGDLGTYYYAWNYESLNDNAYGEMWPMTTSAAVELDIIDANGDLIAANADIALQAYENSYGYPYTCHDYSWSWGSRHSCYEEQTSNVGVYGSASGSN